MDGLWSTSDQLLASANRLIRFILRLLQLLGTNKHKLNHWTYDVHAADAAPDAAHAAPDAAPDADASTPDAHNAAAAVASAKLLQSDSQINFVSMENPTFYVWHRQQSIVSQMQQQQQRPLGTETSVDDVPRRKAAAAVNVEMYSIEMQVLTPHPLFPGRPGDGRHACLLSTTDDVHDNDAGSSFILVYEWI